MAYTPPSTNSNVDFVLENNSIPTNDSVDFSLAEGLTTLSVTPISTTSTTSSTSTPNTELNGSETATTTESVSVGTQTTPINTESVGTSTVGSTITIVPISTTSFVTPTTTTQTSVYTKRIGVTAIEDTNTRTSVHTDRHSTSIGLVGSTTTTGSTLYRDPQTNRITAPIKSVRTLPSTFEITKITPNFKYISNPRVNLLVEYEPRDIDVHYTRDTEVEYE